MEFLLKVTVQCSSFNVMPATKVTQTSSLQVLSFSVEFPNLKSSLFCIFYEDSSAASFVKE